jgi:hypothetical protein
MSHQNVSQSKTSRCGSPTRHPPLISCDGGPTSGSLWLGLLSSAFAADRMRLGAPNDRVAKDGPPVRLLRWDWRLPVPQRVLQSCTLGRRWRGWRRRPWALSEHVRQLARSGQCLQHLGAPNVSDDWRGRGAGIPAWRLPRHVALVKRGVSFRQGNGASWVA